MAIDAISLGWSCLCFYAFPPFSLINRVLPKVQQDQSQGIIIVPMWNTQVWFPRIATPFDRLPSYCSKGTNSTAPTFQSGESTSSSQEAHPSGVQIIRNSLTARSISQKAAKVILQSWRERVHTNNILSTSGNGCCFAVQGVLIHTKQLQHKR